MNAYFTRHGKLPGDLDLLGKQPGYRIAQKDADTAKPYEYDVLGATSYHLCADFAGDGLGLATTSLATSMCSGLMVRVIKL